MLSGIPVVQAQTSPWIVNGAATANDTVIYSLGAGDQITALSGTFNPASGFSGGGANTTVVVGADTYISVSAFTPSNGAVAVVSGTIDNAGTIIKTGGTGAVITTNPGGGVPAFIINRATGTLQGSNMGAAFAQGGTVENYGTVAGLGNTGVFIQNGIGKVTNHTGASITGRANGVALNAGGAVSNGGTIAASAFGSVGVLIIGGAGSVTNTATGAISGIDWGISLNGGGTVDNAGSIEGDQGILITGSAGAVTNSGSIRSATNTGVNLNFGGTLTNSGTIVSQTYEAVRMGGSNSSITNTGTIQGTRHAILANFNNTSVTNHGTISTQTSHGIFAGGSATIINYGTISTAHTLSPAYNAVYTGPASTYSSYAGSAINKGGYYAVQFAGSNNTANITSGSRIEANVGLYGGGGFNNKLNFHFLGNTSAIGALGQNAGSVTFAGETYSYEGFSSVTLSTTSMTSLATTAAGRGIAAVFDNAAAGTLTAPAQSVYRTLNSLFMTDAAAAGAIIDHIAANTTTDTGGITAGDAAVQASSQFSSAIFDRVFSFGSSSGSVVASEDAPGRAFAFASQRHNPIRVTPPRRETWRAWTSGFGGTGRVSQSGGVNESSTVYGGAMGLDYRFSPSVMLGLAVGASSARFSAGATSGDARGAHISLYGLFETGPFYNASAVTFSTFDNDLTRYVAGFGGVASETEKANFDSREWRFKAEFGRHFATSLGTLTPFAAIELAQLRSDGYTETATGGPGVFALSVSASRTTSLPASAGLRWKTSVTADNGVTLTPSLQLAYVHDFGDAPRQTNSLAMLPGTSFEATGAERDDDALQLKSAIEVGTSPNTALFAGFTGEFARDAQAYGGHGGIRLRW